VTGPRPGQRSGPPTRVDVACFGYLADTRVLHVPAYPKANHGTVVHHATTALAGDAPITALACARLGLTTTLVTNLVGADAAGRRVSDLLAAGGLKPQIGQGKGTPTTAHLTVVSDATGARTWFAYLTPALTGLARTNPSVLAHARLAYIDGYQVIAHDAARAIVAAGTVPILLNLGGDNLHPAVASAASSSRLAAVQTSLDESDAERAEELATTLYTRLNPQAAIVTLGRLGALAVTAAGLHHAPTRTIHQPRTHGAGAAFSAGYAHAILAGTDIPTAVQAACQAGATACISDVAEPNYHDTTAADLAV
jgi:sugar/nucleoside kinase (ribokinase family)